MKTLDKYVKCIVCGQRDHEYDAIYCTRCGTKLPTVKSVVH